ncbi:MAG: response regulator [Verrucomicrobiota bacterium]
MADDESDDLFLIEHRLQKAGIKNPIVKFRDGEELIAFFDSQPGAPKPCVLLLDLKMPLVDGIDVLAWLRRHPDLAQLPVAVVTSSPTPLDRERARAAGANEYHEKFPSAEELSAIVARASAHPFATATR